MKVSILLLLGLWLGLIFTPNAQSSPKRWLTVELGIVGVGSEASLEGALAETLKGGYEGLFIILDTPGGALESTRHMVKAIMAAKVPVVVWVGPGGARAASAGAFLTLSGHIAAMAPGTNIGAAHPVQASGEDIDKGDMGKKVENDTVAFMESIATKRSRDPIMARSFVVNSLSVTAEEALEGKVIDLIAPSAKEVLDQIQGREVTLDGGATIKLATKDVTLVAYEKNLKEEFLEILNNPNLFYLLFIAGLLGIGFELTHPGSLVPGVVGAICLILALIATSVLPISFGAMVLIVASIGFMVAEAYLPSFGILGIGGLVAFVVGSFLLVDPEGQQGLGVHWTTIMPTALGVGGYALGVGYLVFRSDRSKVQSGADGLIGQRCLVVEFSQQTGQVKLDGELWKAELVDEATVGPGDHLEVVGRTGLVLQVKPVSNIV